jgi:hypothetical protein
MGLACRPLSGGVGLAGNGCVRDAQRQPHPLFVPPSTLTTFFNVLSLLYTVYLHRARRLNERRTKTDR